MSAWHSEARRLSAQGMTVRQIAQRLGKSRGGVQYALQPEKDSKRPCPKCGAPRSRNWTQCDACRHAEWQAHRERVERMWAEGFSVPEICAATGMKTFPTTAYRDKGWNLPYRYRNTKRQRQAVAA